MRQYIDWLWAALAGVLLACMVTINGGLAAHTTPFTASWVVHGVGAMAAFVLLRVNILLARGGAAARFSGEKPPLWSYLGGAPGAFAVALSSIAVNSELALAGGLSLLLVGQILFGLISDRWGLFGTPQRAVNRFDILAALCVVAGSALVIYSGGKQMIASILIALAGGAAVGMSRSINGRLTMDKGAFSASFWNHFIGFALLTVYIVLLHRDGLPLLLQTPAWAFCGGVIGAAFVAISSYVFPRIGANRSALLIIGAQMITGLAIDYLRGTAQFHPGQVVGVALIVFGIYLTRFSR